MSTTINVTVGGNGLLDQSRQQMQSNRLGKLERDADAAVRAEAQQQRQDQAPESLGRSPQLKRLRQEPAAHRRDELIRIEARKSTGQLELFTSKLPYTLYDAEGYDISLVLADERGPFGDPVIRGRGGPYWTLWIELMELKPLTSDFTFEFWTYFPSSQRFDLATNPVLVGTGGERFSIRPRDLSNELEILVQTPGGHRKAWRAPVTGLIDRWIHIALVRNTGTISVYINGGLVTDDDIDYVDDNYDPSLEWTLEGISLAPTYVFGNSTNDFYWQINQFVLDRKKARYAGSSFTPPTKRL